MKNNNEEVLDTDKMREKAEAVKRKINAADCSNVLNSLRTGDKVSFTASENGFGMKTFEGIFVHYSKTTNLLSVLMNDGTVTAYNVNMIFCISFSTED